MNPIFLLITIHSTLFSLATAQLEPQPEENHNQNQNQPVSNPIHPSIPVVLGILSVMFSVTFLLCAYAKFCHGPARHSDSFRNHDQGLGGLIRSRSRFSGIDKVAIESLPFFRFSSLKGSKQGLECAVCISRFEDSEVLRLLPNCRHAFHMACIDQWLERHSSCPLCRYKFDAREIRSLTYSNSLRYVGNGNGNINTSNPANDLNDLDIFVQREEESAQEASSSSSFISRSFRKSGRGKREETMLADQESDIRPLHKVKHKIVVSDVVIKSRWSDVNSSDLLLLNSEMLSEASSKRFSNSERGNINERFSVEKVKEDMERKRVIDSRLGRSHSDPNNNVGGEHSCTRPLSGEERRSMSEITNVSRFSARNGVNGEEERTRRLWLVIARRTVRWFAGRHTDPYHIQGRPPSNV